MQALQRLVQKNINMNIEIKLLGLSYKPQEVNDGKACELYIQVVRGPAKWQTRTYWIDPDLSEVVFSGD